MAESDRVKYWEIIADNLSKAGWSLGCVSAVSFEGANKLDLLTRIATTVNTSLCTRIKSCLPFSNSNPQFKPTDVIMSAIARNRGVRQLTGKTQEDKVTPAQKRSEKYRMPRGRRRNANTG
jgi:hypothetical protein